MQPEEIRSRIDSIMIEEFECEAESLRPEAQLGDDLDMDSLDGVDLVVALEKAFQCRIPEEEARNIKTLGDIYDKVISRLEAAQEQAS